jgi:ATP-binding cassette subfamily B protein
MEKNRTAFRDILKDFSILYPYFSQNRLPLTIGLLSLLLVDLLQLVVPLIIKRTVDHLATGTATASTLLFYGAAILGLALTIGVFRYI